MRGNLRACINLNHRCCYCYRRGTEEAPSTQLTAADVRKIRRRDLSQAELARRCGISRSYVAQVRDQPAEYLRQTSSHASGPSALTPSFRAITPTELSTSSSDRPALTRTDVAKALGRRSSTERRIDELLRAGRLEERLALGESRDSRLVRRLFVGRHGSRRSRLPVRHPADCGGSGRSPE